MRSSRVLKRERLKDTWMRSQGWLIIAWTTQAALKTYIDRWTRHLKSEDYRFCKFTECKQEVIYVKNAKFNCMVEQKLMKELKENASLQEYRRQKTAGKLTPHARR